MKKKKKNRLVILGLDISSRSTGWAVLKNGRWSKSGSSYGTIKIASKDSVPKRLVSFRNQLHVLIKRVKPTHVVIEEVFAGRNISTAKLLSKFNGVAVELCRRTIRKDPLVVLATEVRRFLGCGSKKENAFKYVCDRYNLSWDFKKFNDVTDALCLCLFGQKNL
jgi:Holliday junction resolvasome RuvABC endonuclease subunit